MKNKLIYAFALIFILTYLTCNFLDREMKPLKDMSAKERLDLFLKEGFDVNSEKIKSELNGKELIHFFTDNEFNKALYEKDINKSYRPHEDLYNEIKRVFNLFDNDYKREFENERY